MPVRISWNRSVKRRKIDENSIMSESLNEESNLSVTIYEDQKDIEYINKSTKERILSTSQSKRSPLSTINKMNGNNMNKSAFDLEPSTSTSSHTSSTKTLVKVKSEPYQLKYYQISPFLKLSDEMLLHIFQFLPKKALFRLALVNQRFSRVVLDESLWIRMDLGNRCLRRGAIGKVISRGLVILRLAHSRIQAPIFESHFEWEGFQSKIEYLDLSLAFIDKTSLAQLLSTCRLLKKLSLESVPVDLNVCREISENSDLEVLNLAMCEGIDKYSIVNMMSKLNSLSVLNISWTDLNMECVDALTSLIPSSMMRLNIAGCRRTLLKSRKTN
jgi:F-box and leucine-rich repeat protein 1 (S-phase kinase-associated protein 2)